MYTKQVQAQRTRLFCPLAPIKSASAVFSHHRPWNRRLHHWLMQKSAVKREAASSNTRASGGGCEGSWSCAYSDIPFVLCLCGCLAFVCVCVCVCVCVFFFFFRSVNQPWAIAVLVFHAQRSSERFSCHVRWTCEQMVVMRSKSGVIKGSECDPVFIWRVRHSTKLKAQGWIQLLLQTWQICLQVT